MAIAAREAWVAPHLFAGLGLDGLQGCGRSGNRAKAGPAHQKVGQEAR